MNTTIDLTNFGGVIAGLLVVGAILKNAFPNFPNRLIPLFTWLIGVLAYQALVVGWTDPKAWVAAVLAAATATGIHSGIKNTVQSEQEAKPIPITKVVPLLLCAAGMVTISGCALSRQYATTTATDPTNGVVTVTVARSTTYAVGDARNAIEKTRASAGKTSSVGATGTEQETSSANVTTNARALLDLLNALKTP